MQTKFVITSIVFLFAISPCLAMTPTAEKTQDFLKYEATIKRLFDRNIDNALLIEKPVTVSFFLTPDGFVYNVSVDKSSGNAQVDCACLDAVCSASPLPAPPELRLVQPPVPAGGHLVPPKYYSTGTQFFYFPEKTSGKLNIASYKIIPAEVTFRYPGLFTSKDLDAESNLITPYPTASLINDTRFQWAKFFQSHKTATKNDVQNLAQDIRKFYLDKKTAVRF